MLLEKVEEILQDGGFDYCGYSGCFDIAARKDSMLLLKVLTNIDSFQEEQANNLKVISGSMEARSLVIGLHTRRERLSDNVVYERFDVPTMTPNTFENIVNNNTLPTIYRFRGGLFTEVDPSRLREAREQKGLSQSELAEKVGITKKSVYEHESRRMKMDYDNAVKMEKILKTELIEPIELEQKNTSVSLAPKTGFETKISRTFRRIGFRTSSVYQSPFNMIAKDKQLVVLSEVDEKTKAAEKKIPFIKNFARLSGNSAVIITREEAEFDMPSVSEKKLSELDAKGLKNLAKKF